MRLYRAAEMQRADEMAAGAGVPTSELMEAAGRAVAESALRHFPQAKRITVLCGKGNNGGDGYVGARYLHEAGREVWVLELAGERTGDAAQARDALPAEVSVERLTHESLGRTLDASDLAIDALFGSGLRRPLEGEIADLVGQVNASGLPLLAVDLPSGLCADSPVPPGPHLRASRTVQLAGAKLASAFEPSRSHFGEQEIADIGIPESILESTSKVRLLDQGVGRSIPQRSREAHKYEVGTVLVLAGSPSYLGAAELACRGAYRAGAGLVTLAAEARLPSSWPEIIFSAIEWDSQAPDRIGKIGEKRAQAVVAGPGLDERALEHLPSLLDQRRVPWVLDAGALDPSEGLRRSVRDHGRCVLTPHAGEAARLLGWSAAEVVGDPIAAAEAIAGEWNAVCVLKGGSTTIASGEVMLVSTEGHEGMASGGTGDVLAGVLGAFLAAPMQAGELPQRVAAAVAVHGLAGRLAGEQLGIGLIASDLIAKLPLALRMLVAKAQEGGRGPE